MKSFRHIVPELRLFHGPDSLEMIPNELDRLKSRRAVIFCGSSLGRQGSPLDLIKSAMGERCAAVYTGVCPQSPLAAVEEAARELRRLDADAVVAVGGGSAIVTARAASILLAENRHVRDLCTTPEGPGKLKSPKLLAPKLPQLVVPTTPTTATVKAGSAVLDPVEGKRLALYDPKVRARSVFIHPELVSSAPREVYVSAGVNTLALAVEGLMSHSGDPLSDALLMHAIRLLAQQLPQATRTDDLAVRSDLMMASIMCGQGSDYTGAGMAIPVGHAISTRFNIDMGISDAIMLPHVLRFSAEAAKAGIVKLAIALGVVRSDNVPVVSAVVDALEAIFNQLGLPRRLRDVGVPNESLSELAAISIDDWYLQGNPRPVRDVAELRGVLEQAW